MTVLLDTASIDPGDRIDAVLAAVGHASTAPHFMFQGGVEQMRFRIEVHVVGPLTITRTTSTGLRLDVTARLLDTAAPAAAALMIHERAPARFEQHGRQRAIAPGTALLNDLTSPYAFSWAGVGRSDAILVDLDQLALPVSTLRDAAAADLRSSPLLGVVLNHIRHVLDNVDAIAADADADVIGRTTTELFRALVADAGGARLALGARSDDAVLAGVLAYVRRHLDDPHLTAAQVAVDQHISLRRLYQVCARADLSLAEWTMNQRLDGARRDLADPALQRHTIARTAHRWGFVDASHFSRRFRSTYGVTPQDWQRSTHAPTGPPDPPHG